MPRPISEFYLPHTATHQSTIDRDRLALVVDTCEIGLWFNPLPLGQLVWNEHVRAHFHMPPDAPAPTVDEFYARLHPDDRPHVAAAVEAALNTGCRFDVEYRTVHPTQGDIKWIRAVGQVFRDSAGVPIHFDGITVDLTSHKHTQEQLRLRERQLEMVSDHIPVLIAHCDAQRRFKFVNQAYAERFRLQPSQIIGRTIHDVLGPIAYASIAPQVDRALAGEILEFEVQVPYRDLGLQLMRCSYTPEHDDSGRTVGFIAVIINITEQRQAALENKRLVESLRETDHKKDVFLSVLAHELRNPLAPLRHALELIKLQAPASPQLDDACQMMDRQLGQMVHLIDDLMDLTRISQGKISLQKTALPVAAAVRNAVETSRPWIDRAQHTLSIDVPQEEILVEADETRLSQVLANLLNNSAKYTEAGGRIDLVVRADADAVEFIVQDNGIGIPPAMLPRVFDMFTQVDRALERSQGGLGIGLNIVKRLVEMHGGTITANSPGHGQGSRFVVRLPRLRTSHTAASAPPPAEATTPRQRRILVVDDNRDAAVSLAMLLRVLGHHVELAHDGLEALSRFETYRPQLVLMDIGMPRLNGYDAARGIRQLDGGRDAVLVALTGWGQDQDRQSSAQAGFDHHLVKPIDASALRHLLAT